MVAAATRTHGGVTKLLPGPGPDTWCQILDEDMGVTCPQ